MSKYYTTEEMLEASAIIASNGYYILSKEDMYTDLFSFYNAEEDSLFDYEFENRGLRITFDLKRTKTDIILDRMDIDDKKTNMIIPEKLEYESVVEEFMREAIQKINKTRGVRVNLLPHLVTEGVIKEYQTENTVDGFRRTVSYLLDNPVQLIQINTDLMLGVQLVGRSYMFSLYNNKENKISLSHYAEINKPYTIIVDHLARLIFEYVYGQIYSCSIDVSSIYDGNKVELVNMNNAYHLIFNKGRDDENKRYINDESGKALWQVAKTLNKHDNLVKDVGIIEAMFSDKGTGCEIVRDVKQLSKNRVKLDRNKQTLTELVDNGRVWKLSDFPSVSKWISTVVEEML